MYYYDILNKVIAVIRFMKNFQDLLLLFISRYKNSSATFYNQSIASSFTSIDFNTFVEKICGAILLFKNLNLKQGSKICIMADTSTNWLAVDIAAMSIGLVSVPLFKNASIEHIKMQISEMEPSCIFVQDYAGKNIVSNFIDKGKIFYISELKNAMPESLIPFIKSLSVSSDMQATTIYTSGTTGNPSGVMLSHFNLISQILSADKHFSLSRDDVAISFLPTAHVFQRMICYLYLYKEVSIYFIHDYSSIAERIKEIKPTLLTTVPRIFDKIFFKTLEQIKQKKWIQGFIARLAFNYAVNHDPSKSHSILFYFYKTLVYSKVIDAFGGRVRMIISGGAKLDDTVYKFFYNISLPIYQGYGMTETSPVIASNYPEFSKCLTVGKAFDGITTKILEDGELCVKGPNVMLGYYKRPEKNLEAFTQDGFLRTGDIAKIDSEGYITIINRKRDIFKTSTGKFVDPNKLEFLLNQSNEIECSCVIADGKPFASAILFVKNKNEDLIKKHINKINDGLEHHEQIKAFYATNYKPSVQSGELTPSLKIRRFFIYEEFKEDIDKMYKDGI